MAQYNMPDWRKVETIEDFVIAVRDTLEVWLLVHTNAECWAEEWAPDGEADYWFKVLNGEIKNDFFHFDWKRAVYEKMAESWLHTIDKCPECEMLLFEGWELDCDCVYDNPDLEEVSCDEDDLDHIVEFMEDCEFEVDDSCAWDALVDQGFKVYQNALNGTIAPHVDEMREAVEHLDIAIDSDDRQDMLVMAREATRIYHVNGQVMVDYGERIGLEFSVVDQVRDEGFDSAFDRNEIRDFLTGD